MGKSIPDWLLPWLNRPGWQLLGVQWLVLLGVMLLLGSLLLVGPWQQRERLYQQRQQLQSQIAESQQQLNLLPEITDLKLRLQQQQISRPSEEKNFGQRLYQERGSLLHWQQQDQQSQQAIMLRLEFSGLLRLLAGISPNQRIGQMKITQQPEGLITQLTLLDSGDNSNE